MALRRVGRWVVALGFVLVELVWAAEPPSLQQASKQLGLSVWLPSSPTASGWAVLSDAPASMADPRNYQKLKGATVHYAVWHDGKIVSDAATSASFMDLVVNALQVRGEADAQWASLVNHYTGAIAGYDGFQLAWPGIVKEDSRFGRRLLSGAISTGLFDGRGLNNTNLRTALWRDTILDLALDSTYDQQFTSMQDVATLQKQQQALMAGWLSRLVTQINQVEGGSLDVAKVPTSLAKVVSAVSDKNIDLAKLMDDSLHSYLLRGVSGQTKLTTFTHSPFEEFQTQLDSFSKSLTFVQLAAQASSDVFDGMALHLATTEQAAVRLATLQHLADTSLCTPTGTRDPAFCEGLKEAEQQFTTLQQSEIAAFAKTFSDPQSLQNYTSTAIQVGGLVGKALAKSGAITKATGATIAKVANGLGAAMFSYQSFSSIDQDTAVLMRAFLAGTLDYWMRTNAKTVDPRQDLNPTDLYWSVQDSRLRARLQVVYFAYLHDAYTGNLVKDGFALTLLHTLQSFGKQDIIQGLQDNLNKAIGNSLVPAVADTSGVVLVAASGVTATRELPGNMNFAPGVNYSVGGEPDSVAVADLNGDNIPDLVVANWQNGDNTVSVLLGNGDGTFRQQTKYATGVSPAQVIVADVNNDGEPDIIVENDGPYPGSQGTVSVLLGNGDGTFRHQSIYPVGSNPVSVTAADVNHDGNLDLITSNWNDDTVSVLLGYGDGTFAPQMTYRVGVNPAENTVADLNHDHNLDIVTTNVHSNDISVLLGNGDGTFRPQSTYPAGEGPGNVVAADLDNDGNLDLVTNEKSNYVDVFLGTGDGTFRSKRTYAAGAEPRGVAVADLNGDGILDIVVGDYANNDVAVLKGNGDGSFQPPSTYPTGTGPRAVAVADLNRDGRLDLISVNFLSNTISVLLGK